VTYFVSLFSSSMDIYVKQKKYYKSVNMMASLLAL